MSSSESAAPSSTRLRAGFLLVVTFILGVLLGAAVDRALLFHQHRMLPREGLRFISGRIVHGLTRELHLTDTQQAQIKAILDRHHQRVSVVWAQVQPQVRKEMEATDHEIEQVLTADQRPRFHELSSRWHAHAGRLLGGH